MATLTVTWPRGAKHSDPLGTVYFEGDAPCEHPAFEDAKLDDHGEWRITRKVYCKSAAETYGQDRIRHLRSWGVRGTAYVTK